MTAPDHRSARPGVRQPFGSLRNRAFRWWFASQLLSASGSMTQSVAQSWLVLRLTGSGLDLGLLTSCGFLPLLLAGPFAGTFVDRADRRRLLITTQSLFILLACVLAVLAGTGTARVWMLFLIAAAGGLVSVSDGAGRQVYVVELVGTGRVASAVSLNEVVLNTSRVLGPATSGVLLATSGVAACCLVNAASYLPPLAVLLVHRPAPRAAAPVARREPGQVRAGLRYSWQHRPIRACLFLAAASGMLFNLSVPLGMLTTRVFHLGGGGYGLMMAAFGAGALPGAFLAAASPARPTGRGVGTLALATGLAILAVACAPSPGLAAAGLAVTGCLSIWFIARANTLVQLETSPDMRGRVNATWNMALPGCEPVTSPLVGWTAGATDARGGFGLAAIALLLAAGAGWRWLTGPAPAAAPAAQQAPPGGLPR